jgi:ABC-type transporter MlaC component
MKSLMVAAIVTAYFFNGDDPQRMLETQYKSYITVQALNPHGIEKYRDRILDKTKRLPRSTQRFLDTNIDWEVYAESIFRPNWDKLTMVQQAKFKRLLQRDVIDRYGDLFSPSLKFSAKFNGNTEYEVLRGHKFAKVSTTLSSLRNDTEVDIAFIFHHGSKRWALCDIYVDGVSKSKLYRQEVRKIYKREGYAGVVKAFRKRHPHK